MDGNLLTENNKHFTWSGGLAMTCGENHIWTWAGSDTKPPEGLKCNCGMMEYHIGKCQYCGSEILQPKIVSPQ